MKTFKTSHDFPRCVIRYALTASLLLAGCGTQNGGTGSGNSGHSSTGHSSTGHSAASTGHGGSVSYNYGYGDADDSLPSIEFPDSVTPQAGPDWPLVEAGLFDRSGNKVTLPELAKDRNVVLVVLRGWSGALCPYCTTQTSRFIANYKDVTSRNAEVVVVYPIEQANEQSNMNLLLTKAQKAAAAEEVPFPIVLDVGFQVSERLGLRTTPTKPAIYILDKSGAVRFAYVGKTLADRPSIKTILEQLDRINAAS